MSLTEGWICEAHRISQGAAMLTAMAWIAVLRLLIARVARVPYSAAEPLDPLSSTPADTPSRV